MNYRNIYCKIIRKAKADQNNRKQLKLQNIYFEKHHILPKSLFPLWKRRESNLILLTPREHFFCHQLLEKIYPGRKMCLALWWLVNDGQNNYCKKNSKTYERIKQNHSKTQSERFYALHQNPEYKRRHKEKMNSPEVTSKISESLKSYYSVPGRLDQIKEDKFIFYDKNPEVKNKISETMKKHWQDPEYRKNQIEKQKAGITPERREQLRLSVLGLRRKSTPVICLETNVVYTSKKCAALAHNLCPKMIEKAIHSNTLYGNYHWSYVSPVENMISFSEEQLKNYVYIKPIQKVDKKLQTPDKAIRCIETGVIYGNHLSAVVSNNLISGELLRALYSDGFCNGQHWKYTPPTDQMVLVPEKEILEYFTPKRKKYTPEQKLNQSNAAKNWYSSNPEKAQARLDRLHTKCQKAIHCPELNRTWPTMKLMSEELKINEYFIRKSMKNKMPYGGYTFIFQKDIAI